MKAKRMTRKRTKRKTKKKNKPKSNKAIKKERKNLTLRVPTNFNFWYITIQNPKEIEDFISRGNDRQKECIKRTFNYVRKTDIEDYERLVVTNG